MAPTWDAGDVLGIDPSLDGFKCVGTTLRGVRCLNTTTQAYRDEATSILKGLGAVQLSSDLHQFKENILPKLDLLAEILLCLRWHRYKNSQVTEVADRWYARVLRHRRATLEQQTVYTHAAPVASLNSAPAPLAILPPPPSHPPNNVQVYSAPSSHPPGQYHPSNNSLLAQPPAHQPLLAQPPQNYSPQNFPAPLLPPNNILSINVVTTTAPPSNPPMGLHSSLMPSSTLSTPASSPPTSAVSDPPSLPTNPVVVFPSPDNSEWTMEPPSPLSLASDLDLDDESPPPSPTTSTSSPTTAGSPIPALPLPTTSATNSTLPDPQISTPFPEVVLPVITSGGPSATSHESPILTTSTSHLATPPQSLSLAGPSTPHLATPPQSPSLPGPSTPHLATPPQSPSLPGPSTPHLATPPQSPSRAVPSTPPQTPIPTPFVNMLAKDLAGSLSPDLAAALLLVLESPESVSNLAAALTRQSP